jgi:hypothetical protein
VHLSPKAFDLLKVLIDHRPRVLSKHELRERLWPATFVSDANLTCLIAEIREALRDTARRPRFIRTVHRVGYAFCDEAAFVQEPAPSNPTTYCWLVMKGRRAPLQAGEKVLGRDVDCIEIHSPTVSRRHARIVVGDTEALLEDLGSKNGTFVCGKGVSAGMVCLKDGDEIRTGSVVFHFRMTSRRGATATWSGAEETAVSSASQRGHPVEDDGDAR